MAELEYRKCTQGHIRYIMPQPGDEQNKMMYLSPDYAAILTDHFSMSVWAGSQCLGAAGIITIHQYRGMAWALLGANAGPHLLQITRKVRGAIDLHPCKRIEITVDYNFKQGHQWAKLLGLDCEAPRMRGHGVFGNDETLYARVR